MIYQTNYPEDIQFFNLSSNLIAFSKQHVFELKSLINLRCKLIDYHIYSSIYFNRELIVGTQCSVYRFEQK